MTSKKQAFTLIEVLIAIAIVALAASLVVPVVQGNKNKAAYQVSIVQLKSVGKAMEHHYLEKGSYPVFSDWSEVCAEDSPLLEYLNDIPVGDAFNTPYKILQSDEVDYEIQGWSLKGKLKDEFPDYFLTTGGKVKTKKKKAAC